jgi:hypothetical protein
MNIFVELFCRLMLLFFVEREWITLCTFFKKVTVVEITMYNLDFLYNIFI